MDTEASPFILRDVSPIDPYKFTDPHRTAKGEKRASIALEKLETLWFNTGTLCNLACKSCYIESSPKNDALVYITLDEMRAYLDEIARESLPTREIAFTGGEPFMNPDMIAIIRLCLDRGFKVLVLSNAMRPMRRFEQQLLDMPHRERLTIRVSLDHYTKTVHEAERGVSWDKAIDGLQWLASNGFNIAVAGRHLEHETDNDARVGFGALFGDLGLTIDANDPAQLVLFPEMDETADVPEITAGCWDILSVDPHAMMCSSSRMVVKRKGEETPRVVACTLLPYQDGFDLGETLAEASCDVSLNHPHCARFCVLGGASCTA
ncbi:radical SAM protein [uncultured Erythrobacter sp.]|uniref:radical SAM protein n=1 Tax=uncultured Erythrobacter sp. TaxID=263913 RepID=UPI002620771F|nr:radical SAM protein [uncultured Erythrobacter sp.]